MPRPRWRRLLRHALTIAALAVVFGWVLPRFIDYDQVWAALTQLDAGEMAVLLGVALARIPAEGLMYRAFLPGLRLWRGTEAYLSSNLAGQVLPPPTPSVVQSACFRGDGYAPDAAGLAALGSFLFPTIGRLLLPVVAIVLLLITGEVNGTILLAALRYVGVSGSELSAADAFAAFAIAFWAGTVFPITGSGLGVVDAVLVAALIELSSASDDVLVAAALLWRVFYSVIPLPLGAITLSRLQKANPDVLRRGTGAGS